MKLYVLSLLTLVFFEMSTGQAQEKTKIILDADTANEVDDPFAIVRAFAEPTWEIQALNATQWQASQWTSDRSMEEGHRINQVLVAYLKPENTKLLRGGHRRMYDWGDMALHSAATYNIIKEAHLQTAGEKLTIVALGALTNVASAVFIDPTISSKIKLYWLGTTYDFKNNSSKRTDFNPMMDPQAAELLLSSEVEMHILPVSEVNQMKSKFSETKKRLAGKHDLGDYLVQHWFDHDDGGREERVLWDIALIEAMLHPEWVTEVKVDVFENKEVYLYKDIDKEKFLNDCFDRIVAKLEKL
ncbi:nucleoside hydrolase [Ulvibacterium marinum]|uniref:Nucleoside hydrolase n=1 Tax=Ulvibacterium marinum TaxID=2419782 RepID=A0A3B0BXZ4_9FLAO|nr:nucleoside hydrolase [Ulvibacterium marinum]RKN77882.1 nucleoside hydrolase [Ulvibacterium marinum]